MHFRPSFGIVCRVLLHCSYGISVQSSESYVDLIKPQPRNYVSNKRVYSLVYSRIIGVSILRECNSICQISSVSRVEGSRVEGELSFTSSKAK